MKRLMITCAALGLLAGGAHAQDDMMADDMMAPPSVTISGAGGLGLIFTGANKGDESRLKVLTKFDIGFAASGTTDQGLTFGAKSTIESRGGQGQGGGDQTITDAEVHIGGEIWKVTAGDLDPATHMANNISDIGYDGIGIDDMVEKAAGSTTANVNVTLTFGPASVGFTAAAVTPLEADPAAGSTKPAGTMQDDNSEEQDNHWAIGGKADIAPVTLAFGYDSNKDLKASISGTMNNITAKGLVALTDKDVKLDNVEAVAAEVAVTVVEGTTLTAIYAQKDFENKATPKEDGFGVGVSHDLGGGATVQAGFGQVNDVNKANVGVVMSF